VRAVIRVVPADLRVDEALAAAVLALRPTLARHTCKQRGFGLFGDTLIGTTLPHLVEHVAIDLLVEDERRETRRAQAAQAGPQASRPRAGTTTWLDRERGVMEVRLSCASDGDTGVGDTNATDAEVTRVAIIRAVTLVNTLLARLSLREA
jgi:hypothetical protein